MTSDAFPEPAATTSAEFPQAEAAADSLRQAMRRARLDNAERAGVLADLHLARVGRLDLLRDALQPLVDQIPPAIDIFDICVLPGERPRLFVDMIGFVEMGRDARVYRLLQDSRHGRIEIAQSESVATMVEAVTDYVARRLLERDKALAADAGWPAPAMTPAGRLPSCFAEPPRPLAERAQAESAAGDTVAPAPLRPSARRRSFSGWVALAFALLIDTLGTVVFFALLVGLAILAWTRFASMI